MIKYEELPSAPPGTHWEKRDFVVDGEVWCIVRDGLRGSIVSSVPNSELKRSTMLACCRAASGAKER